MIMTMAETLHQKKAAVAAAQGLVTAGELLLWGASLCGGASPAVLCCAVLCDWLLFSPLKAGRALFFETLTADAEAATVPLLFRYYRHGYGKAVGWRAYVWGQRLLWSAMCSVPTLALFSFANRQAVMAVTRDEQLTAQAVTVLSLLLTAGALLAVNIRLLRFSLVPYLLSYPHGLAGALATSRCLTVGQLNRLIQLHILYFVRLPLRPWIGVSVRFQVAKAMAVRCLLREKPEKNFLHVLQHQKKCGRIGR